MHNTFRNIIAFLLCCTTLSAIAGHPKRWEVTFQTTEGDIVLALYDETPIHADNFIRQVKAKTYDGVLFHRVIKDFMIQAGDPTSKTAAPGDKLGEGTNGPADWLTPEIRLPEIYHRRGVLAAARRPDAENPERKSSNQQFYIVTKETTPWLDGAYTIFGEVIKGMDTVDRIEAAATDQNDRPLQDRRILKARVTKKGKKIRLPKP